jgi:homoserine/homoserine lactone efflux protein
VDWNSLAQFSAATLLVLITPGPVMAIIAHNTLRYGPRAGLSTAIGVGLGEVCLLGAMLAGLSLSGELLPVLFRWLSLAGALYLIWLAAGALRLRNRPSRWPNLSRTRTPVLDGLAIAFASPAALLFYAAFFPQFMDPDHSISKQVILLSAVYVFACARSPPLLASSQSRASGYRSALHRAADLRIWAAPQSISRSQPSRSSD